MTKRDSMVIVPSLKAPRDSGPARRAREERNLARTKRKRSALAKRLRKAKMLRRMQAAKSARRSRALSKGSKKLASGATRGVGLKAASRFMGPVGVALLAMDAINIVGSGVRRGQDGVSGRLLEAMDQDGIYARLDEYATGASKSRGIIEGNQDLLEIIGIEGRVNSQIGRLGAYFRERETARAIGEDIIEREPGFDHLTTIADKAIVGAANGIKDGADGFVNAIRKWSGKGPLTR